MESDVGSARTFQCKALAGVRQSFCDQTEESRMSTVQGQSGADGGSPSSETADLKLEVVVIPVADADRSKAFYSGLGWRLDADFSFDNGFRVVQFTPPGSPCSVQFGAHITGAPPGSAHGLYLIVSDIEAGRGDLVNRGATVSEVFHSGAPGAQLDPDGAGDRVSGPDPDHTTYSSFATFEDPDGNSWLLQEVTGRLPGRLDPTVTVFQSAGDLAAALRRAESAHGEHEKRIGRGDPDWPDWYAEYMAREQSGQELPT
jgi:catechol 2,3-dioxygenase-like lactoylglutathione lyase family enzyme